MSLPVADSWYETEKLSDGVTLIRETHVAPWLRCNIWHVRGRDRDLIIDTGMGLRPMKTEVAELAGRPLTAIVTHTHFDHAGGLHEFDHRCGHAIEADIIAAPTAQNTVVDTGYVRAETLTALPHAGYDILTYTVKPAPLTDHLDDGDVVDLGDRVFQIFHLPGHSPGSIALFEAKTGILFSGDVVYDGDLLDDLYHSNAETLEHSLQRLLELPIDTVHAGHEPSFDRDRLKVIVAEYLAGGRRPGNIEEWIRNEIGS